ncbi:MAG: FtsX-like permease family protein, partial [Blastocatellia bacterium]
MSYLELMYSNSLLVLMAAVGLVLLIACANVASLLLARAASRRKEMAVRSAIGAGRSRLIRQLLTESLLLATIGGGLGILFCFWGSRFLLQFIFTDSSIPADLEPGGAVLWYTLILSVATGLSFGLAPAFRSTRLSLASTLKDSATNLSGSSSKSVLARALIIGQVALSLVLLVGAGLLARSFQKLKNVNLGFSPDGVIVAQLDAQLVGYKGDRLRTLYGDLMRKLKSIPGAVSVSVSDPSPIGGGENISAFSIPGRPEDPNDKASTHVTLTGSGFFQTLGIRLMRGRDFTQSDDKSSPDVAVVNQKFARSVFGNDDPIGKQINFGSKEKPDIYEIVGLAEDAKYIDVK